MISGLPAIVQIYVSVAVLADGVEQFSLWDFLKADMTNSVSVQCSYHNSCEGSQTLTCSDDHIQNGGLLCVLSNSSSGDSVNDYSLLI